MSIMTVFILFSLFLYTLAVFESQSNFNDRRSSINTGLKIVALESFIGEDLLSLSNITRPVMSKNTTTNLTEITFRRFGTLPALNFSNISQEYASFISSNFSYIDKINLTLSNLTSNMSISGHNITMVFDTNESYIYFDNPENVRNITIVLVTNGTIYWNSTVPTNDPEGQNITIKVIDTAGNVVYNQKMTLNPSQINEEISIFFNDTGVPSLTIDYGTVTGRPGTFRIRSRSIYIAPQDLKMTLTLVPGEQRAQQDTKLRIIGNSISRNDSVSLTKV
ncbi:MAG: hypothetical protein AABX51_04540 [Nanoarchaeota archaeon]